jgi:biopolymer transport protein ExbB/TolQ
LGVFIPNNTVSFGIVIIMLILALGWLGLLVWTFFEQKKILYEIKSINNLFPLAASLRNNLYKIIQHQGNDTDDNISENFHNFCRDNNLIENSFLKRYIYRVYMSSAQQLRFDLKNVLEQTLRELTRNMNLLRGLSPTFFIFGLLGTLFGLSGTLSGLGKLIGADNNGNNLEITSIASNITNVLDNIGNAFATSFWGVIITVITLLILNFYNRYIYIPVRDSLYEFTYTKLNILQSPALFKEAEIVELDIPKNNKSKKNDKSFLEELSERNKELTVQLAQIANYGGSSFSSFSDFLSIQKQINTSIMQIKEISEYLNQNYIEYLDYRKQTDHKNDEIFKEAEEVVNDLKNRNNEFINNTVIPVQESLREGLSYISDAIDRLSPPINEATTLLRNSIDTLAIRNDKITKKIDEQLQTLNNNNNQLKEFLEKNTSNNYEFINRLIENNKIQSEQIKVFNKGLKIFYSEKFPIRDRIKLFFVQLSCLFMKSLNWNKNGRR